MRVHTSIASVSQGRPRGSPVSSSTTITSTFVWSICTISSGLEAELAPGVLAGPFSTAVSPRRLARVRTSTSSRRCLIVRQLEEEGPLVGSGFGSRGRGGRRGVRWV